jgi:hypothetical protein
LRHDLDLAAEALVAYRGGDFRMHELQRDQPIVFAILGQKNRRHPTAAKLALDGVAAGDELERRGGIHSCF